MVLDSQVQNPLGLQVQHALTVCAVYLNPLFSSGCPADSPNKGFKPHQRH